jgi:hypothetical protein
VINHDGARTAGAKINATLIISKQIDVQNGAVADAGYTSAEPQ